MRESILHENKARVFIAIPFPSDQRPLISSWMEKAKKKISFKRWVHRDDLHITLQFLGDTPAELLPSIRKKLHLLVQEKPPFSLLLTGLGFFGKKEAPRVLWGAVDGVEDSFKQLFTLRQKVVQSMEEIGFQPEERPYRPHLTLARHYMEGEAPFPPLHELERGIPPFPASKEAPLPFLVNEIILYKTHFGQTPMYEVLDRFPLKGPSSPHQ